MFLLYMNDLAFCVPEFYTILFADDTSLSLAGDDYTQLLLKFKTLLCKVSVWLRTNLLSLNVGKTKYILFKSPREDIVHQQVLMESQEVYRIGINLQQKTQTVYLRG